MVLLVLTASAIRPLYVSQRDWIFLILALPLYLPTSSIYIEYESAGTVSRFISDSLSIYAIPAYLFMAIGFVPATLCIRAFLKSRRIEFYKEHVRVFTSLITKRTVDIPYSRIEIGPLKVGFRGAAPSYRFKMSIKQETAEEHSTAASIMEKSKSLPPSLNVRNGMIRDLKIDLYSMLKNKTDFDDSSARRFRDQYFGDNDSPSA